MSTVSHLQNYLATLIKNQTHPPLDLSVAAAKEGSSSLGCKIAIPVHRLIRLEVEDERASRERSSDPLGLESCATIARDAAKHRRGIGGVGIELRHVQKKKKKG